MTSEEPLDTDPEKSNEIKPEKIDIKTNDLMRLVYEIPDEISDNEESIPVENNNLNSIMLKENPPITILQIDNGCDDEKDKCDSEIYFKVIHGSSPDLDSIVSISTNIENEDFTSKEISSPDCTEEDLLELKKLLESKPKVLERYIKECATADELNRLHSLTSSGPLSPRVYQEARSTSVTSDLFQLWLSSSPVKAPLPPPSWLNTFEAIDRRVTCSQATYRDPPDGTKSEDCLTASVYVPDTTATNLPVYVIIHGGAYQYGFGNRHLPKEFVSEKNIIAVTFNYRLGVHGLLCLGTEMVPGNAAGKDQVAALRWIKDNIASFGGNPDDITLSGDSAGGSSADLLLLSKAASGLFQKLIVMSGSSVAHWSADQKPLKRAQDFARRLNFTNFGNVKALEQFFTTTPLRVLWSEEEMFAPCVERTFRDETFLDQAPVEIIKSGNYPKIPILYGFSNKEGIYKVEPDFVRDSKIMNENFADILPLDLHFDSISERDAVAQRVKEFYFGDKAIDKTTVTGYIDFQSDSEFIYPMIRAARMYLESGNNQVHLFEYAFPTKHIVLDNIEVVGATHSASTKAFFDEDMEMINEYRKMKAEVREMWYQFANTGNPVSPSSKYLPWPPVDSANGTPYMVLDVTTTLKKDFGDLTKRIQLWDELFDKYYTSAVPPKTFL